MRDLTIFNEINKMCRSDFSCELCGGLIYAPNIKRCYIHPSFWYHEECWNYWGCSVCIPPEENISVIPKGEINAVESALMRDMASNLCMLSMLAGFSVFGSLTWGVISVLLGLVFVKSKLNKFFLSLVTAEGPNKKAIARRMKLNNRFNGALLFTLLVCAFISGPLTVFNLSLIIGIGFVCPLLFQKAGNSLSKFVLWARHLKKL